MFPRLYVPACVRLAVTAALASAATLVVSADESEPPNKNVVRETGVIHGSEATTIVSPISATLFSIAPEGTAVRKGDLLLALDDSRLNSQLTRQQTVTKQALDAWALAEKALNDTLIEQRIQLNIAAQAVRLAELARQEVLGEKGIHAQEVTAAKCKKRVAEMEVDLIGKRIEALRESSAADGLEKAQLELVEAESRVQLAAIEIDRLEGVTRSYRETQAELAILRARADSLRTERDLEQKRRASEKNVASREKLMESMKNKLKVLEEQIAACQVFAPHDGLVQYPQELAVRAGRANRRVNLPGRAVRAEQAVMRLVKTDQFIVETRMHPAKATRVEIGQNALVHVDAMPNHALRGVVKEVSATIDQRPVVDEGQAQYLVTVSIEPPHPNLQIGLTAVVEIDTAE